MPKSAKSTKSTKTTGSGTKRIRCTCCDRPFRNPCDLTRHYNAGIKSHWCDYPGCSASFVQKGALKDHVAREHTKETAKACPFCPLTFGAAYQVTYHFQKKHTDLLWYCRMENCDHKGARDEATFKKHVKWNHPEHESNYRSLAKRPNPNSELAAAQTPSTSTAVASSSTSPSTSLHSSASCFTSSTPSLSGTPSTASSSSFPSSPAPFEAYAGEVQYTTSNEYVPNLFAFDPVPVPYIPETYVNPDDFVAALDWYMTAPEAQLYEPAALSSLEQAALDWSMPSDYIYQPIDFNHSSFEPLPTSAW